MQEGGGRSPAPPPLSVAHCSVAEVVFEKKKVTKQKRWQGELGIQAEALSMLYFLWVESKVNLLV